MPAPVLGMTGVGASAQHPKNGLVATVALVKWSFLTPVYDAVEDVSGIRPENRLQGGPLARLTSSIIIDLSHMPIG